MKQLLLTGAISLMSCAPFQPHVAVRPTPYSATTEFSLVPTVRMRPELDQGTFAPSANPEHREPPDELAHHVALVSQCLTSRAPTALHPYRVFAEPQLRAGAFVVEFGMVTTRPGFYRSDRQSSVTTTASAPGSTASATAGTDTASTHVSGNAEVMLEVRAPSGAMVDQVRIFAQRFPGPDEPIDQRSSAICALLLDEARQYFQWRLAGNGL
jgi:hypothetical protein